jgi:hypothetical protein
LNPSTKGGGKKRHIHRWMKQRVFNQKGRKTLLISCFCWFCGSLCLSYFSLSYFLPALILPFLPSYFVVVQSAVLSPGCFAFFFCCQSFPAGRRASLLNFLRRSCAEVDNLSLHSNEKVREWARKPAAPKHLGKQPVIASSPDPHLTPMQRSLTATSHLSLCSSLIP